MSNYILYVIYAKEVFDCRALQVTGGQNPSRFLPVCPHFSGGLQQIDIIRILLKVI